MGDQTTLLQSYIEEFILGRLDIETLTAAFRQAIADDPENSLRITRLVEKRLYAGEFPTAAYSSLKKNLNLPDSAPPPRGGGKPDPLQDRQYSETAETVLTSQPEDDFSLGEASPNLESRDAKTVVSSTESQYEKTQVSLSGDPSDSPVEPSGRRTTESDWPLLESDNGPDEVLGVGSVIKERFQLLQTLGKGGMGVVFKAIDQRKVEAQDRDPYLAVKVLNEAFKQHPQALRALQREARKTQELAHPNIMTVYDFDRQGNNVYMTMEFMDGEELADLIKKRRKDNTPFAPEEAIDIIQQMCNGLGYAHKKGLVHSDFKPGNVFVTKSGTVKLLDFGIASRVRPTNAAEVSDGDKTAFDPKELGAFTPAYASCEILEGEISHQTDDIYALACVAYQLLGGKHPFNRLKATDARDAGLKPAPIPGLSKRQNRTLAKGLAFTRAERCQSVEEFLDGVTPKKSRTIPVAMAVAATLVVIGLALRGPIVSYLNEQKEQELLTRMSAGDPASMTAALVELDAIADYNLRRNILDKGRETILGYYTDRVDAAIDQTRRKYDYPTAQKLLDEARQLYPDSAQVARIEETITSRKSEVINELTSAFNDLVDRGELLAIEGKQDIPTILDIVGQIDPQHPLLSNPRLAPAYSRAANIALRNQQLDQAEALVLAGLDRFSDNANLINMRDEIAMRRQEIADAQAIEEVLEELTVARQPSGIAGYEKIRDSLITLAKLSPDHPVLSNYTAPLQSVVRDTLEEDIASLRWEAAERLLNNYGELLDSRYVRTARRQLASAKGEFDNRLDALAMEFNRAMETETGQPSSLSAAETILSRMEETAPSDIRVQIARTKLALAHLNVARSAAANGNWEIAEQNLNLALSRNPPADWMEALRFQREQWNQQRELAANRIPAAQKEDIRNQRSQLLSRLQTEFESKLPRLYQDEGVTVTALATLLHKVAALDPDNADIAANQEKIVAKISQQASIRADNNEWEQSVGTLQQGLLALPDSASLQVSLQENLAARSTQLARREAERARQLQLGIEELLASPRFNADWRNGLREQLTELSQIGSADTQWLEEIKQRIADLYFQQADERVQQERFADARSLLLSGQRLLPDNDRFTQRLATVKTALAEFNKKAERQALAAEIESRKQLLLAQSQANDLNNALATFGKLRSMLPGDDPFIREQAPKAIGSAYYNVAKKLAEADKHQEAYVLVERGLKIDQDHPELKKVRDTYREEAYVSELREQAPKIAKLDPKRYLGILEDFRKRSPKRYQVLREEVGDNLLKRVKTIESQDPRVALALLRASQELFPQHRGLADATVTAAAASAARRGTTATGRACNKSIAGHGVKRRGTCYDVLASKARGPLMVVVPGDRTFAISKFEISVRDYNSYCLISKACQPLQTDIKLPVTGIPVESAKKYATWLSEITGYQYRLPTDEEWVYAASAGGKTGGTDFNCLLKMGGKTLKGNAMLPVNSGKPNGWGLINHLGNAQEMVLDGDAIVVRGGAYTDLMSKCDVSLKKEFSGPPDHLTGFRLVREIKG